MSTLYALKYNFGLFQNDVQYYLQSLAQKSLNTFKTQVTCGSILKGKSASSQEYKKEQDKVISFIGNIEDFLYYHYMNSRANFHNIHCEVASVNSISVLDEKDRGSFGLTKPTKQIRINPNIPGTNALSKEDRTRLYVARELSHVINSRWMHSAKKFIDAEPNLTNTERSIMYEGVSLLDQAISQDRGESIAYNFARKRRPISKNHIDPIGNYGGETYKTNFESNGILERPAILFGRTLKGLSSIPDDEFLMLRLSDKALDPEFFNKTINEYKKANQTDILYDELIYLGMIKMATQSRFGHNAEESFANYKKALEVLTDMTSKVKNSREAVER